MYEDKFGVGKFIKGREVVDSSSSDKFVNFYFEDGSHDTAPIIEGNVVIEFDNVSETEVEEEEEIKDEETEKVELGFYKTLEPIPYTDEEGNELGKTEIGSIQEVPVELGDAWVEQGLAEKVDGPEPTTLGKAVDVIKDALGIG